MNTLWQLFKADLLGLLNWYRSQTVGRLVVTILFLALFAVLSVFGYFLSLLFFRGLSEYALWGRLSAEYLLQASIVVIFWFALAAAVISGLTFLLTADPKIDYLLTLPLSAKKILAWFFCRSFFLNTFLFLCLFTPVVSAFSKIFGNGFSPAFLLSFIAVVAFLVSVSSSLGTGLAYLLAPLIWNKKMIAATSGALMFIFSLVSIIKIVFPRQLYHLTDAQPEEFWQIYQNLPLNHPLSPAYWLTRIISDQNFLLTLAILIVATGIPYLTVSFLSGRFIPLYQRLKEFRQQGLFFIKTRTARYLASTRQPLIAKDMLSITRSPAEMSYAIFLFLLGIFFFSMLSVAKQIRFSGGRGETELVLFSFAWLAFFTLAFLLRLSFPLIAREGICLWYLFSLPINKTKILDAKILFGTIISLPYLLLGILIWNLMPFRVGDLWILGATTSYTILTLVLIIGFSGAIMPNFSDGGSPEKVSTSLTGLMALVLSGVIVAAQLILLRAYLINTMERTILLLGILPNIAVVGLLFLAAGVNLKRYQF